MFYVYILKSNKRKFSYVGVTNNLRRRLKEHQNGESRSTAAYRPLMFIYHEEYTTLSEARKREWFLKCTPQGGKFKRNILVTAGVAVTK